MAVRGFPPSEPLFNSLDQQGRFQLIQYTNKTPLRFVPTSHNPMKCPRCSSTDIKVIDSRVAKEGNSIRRRRECLNCGHRFNTVEEILHEGLMVLKSDGRSEEFDRTKIFNGIRKATEKLPVDIEQINLLVNDVIDELMNEYDYEIPSRAIGENIMFRLKKIDQIAYVRFACVYKDFRDINELMQDISNLNT
jgi:transcriptional repressor NrdR